MKTDEVTNKPALVGAVEPRLHTPWMDGASRVNEIEELAIKIGQPLLPWQSLILRDMCAVDEENMFIKKGFV
jgi:hypothetical protein